MVRLKSHPRGPDVKLAARNATSQEGRDQQKAHECLLPLRKCAGRIKNPNIFEIKFDDAVLNADLGGNKQPALSLP